MNEYAWTNGEKPIRSTQKDNPIYKNKTEFSLNMGEFRIASNKREEFNDKLNNRELIVQNGQNPFLMNNNYIQDLEIEQTFLRPQNSNSKYI